jgi:hypothetical protein
MESRTWVAIESDACNEVTRIIGEAEAVLGYGPEYLHGCDVAEKIGYVRDAGKAAKGAYQIQTPKLLLRGHPTQRLEGLAMSQTAIGGQWLFLEAKLKE